MRRRDSNLVESALVLLLFSVYLGGEKLGPANSARLTACFNAAALLFAALAFAGVFTSLKRRRA